MGALIGDEHKEEAGAGEPNERFGSTRQETHVLRRQRRLALAGMRIEDLLDQNTVAVEEDRRAAHRVDSHFMAFANSLGWLTMPCQTTAWKASVCGVTVCALTVGTTTQASATCFV